MPTPPTSACRFGADLLDLLEEDGSRLDPRHPVVALETAVLTHGLPAPQHVEAMEAMVRAVRGRGAIPAVIGALDGQLVVGMNEEERRLLAEDPDAVKASTRDLAWAIATHRSAGTTVAAVLATCRLAGIRIFATGGIGGVHRGWTDVPDVSADLDALAAAPVLVVCAGAKSILDLPATLEALETRSVPVLAWRTDAFPQFHASGDPERLPAPRRLDTLDEVVTLLDHHWRRLDRPEGVLLARPVPAESALRQADLDALVDEAVRAAATAGVRGRDVTPYLLDHLARASAGRTLRANLALLEANAALAADIAFARAGIAGGVGTGEASPQPRNATTTARR